MSFARHPNFGQQWAPGPSPAASPHDRHPSSYHHPHHQNIPPPVYGANDSNYYSTGFIPNAPSTNGHLPPHASLPFPNAVPPPYPPYGAPPVPPPGFPPFPPASHPQPGNEYISNASMPRPASDVPGESYMPRSPVESSEAFDNEREEGELSNGELDDSFIHDGSAQAQTGLQDTSAEANNTSNSPSIISNSPDPALQHRQPMNPGDHNQSGYLDVDDNDTQMIDNDFSVLLDSKSPAQLRTLAQGALLNLAPHNIRFNELVKEGLDPVILRSLYDGIGIKVSELANRTDPDQSIHVLPGNQEADLGETASSPAFPSVTSGEETRRVPKSTSAIEVTTSPTTKHIPATEAPSSASDKPLERKDLIARMLAAKAGKPTASGTAQSIPAARAKEVTQQPNQPAELVEDTTMEDADNFETATTSAEVRVKEINKAQTELARQRMERLKKEGLRRNQTQHIADSGCASTPTDSENSTLQPVASQSASTSSQQAALRYPLPDRPPEPGAEPSTHIPGLFMTGSEPATTAEPTASGGNLGDRVRAPRKRPRASDFTDDIELSSKIPTGSNVPGAEQRVIINISDDEESMYGSDDDNAAASQRSGFESNVVSQSAPKRPLRNNARHPTTNGNSHIPDSTTSSLPQTPKQHRHLQKEIDQLRQEIAERERRRSEKLAADQTQAGATPIEPATTPSAEARNNATDNSPSESAAAEFHADRATPSRKEAADNNLSTDDFGTIEEPNSRRPGECSTVLETKESPRSSSQGYLDSNNSEDLRLKVLRRKEIESGLPALDAELLKSEARLVEFVEQQKKLEAEIAKGRAGRLKLMEELQGLGIETDGLTIEELQQAKGSLEQNGNVMSNFSVPHEPAAGEAATDNTTAHSRENLPADTMPEFIPSSSEGDSVEESFTKEVYGAADSVQPSGNELGDSSNLEYPEEDRASRSSSAMDESMGSEADSEEHSPAPEDHMHLTTEPDVPVSPGIESEAMSVVSSASERPGSKSSPSADSKQPADHPPPDEVDEDAVTSRQASIASETYEPPEPSVDSPATYSPPFSPPPADSAGQMDMEPTDSAPIQEIDELTSKDQPMLAGTTGTTKDEDRPSNQHFTPYESPLSWFRAYRYHPQYSDSIGGGFRSLTYSHNINPHDPLCSYEASGGVCNDRSCQSQHFRDMGLSDDKILVEMGSLREGKTTEEQEEYVTGLRQIINDMRRDKVKDFNTVATEIAAYRRRFLKDPSRVLAL